MKKNRFICMILSLIMLFSLAIPVAVSAEGLDDLNENNDGWVEGNQTQNENGVNAPLNENESENQGELEEKETVDDQSNTENQAQPEPQIALFGLLGGTNEGGSAPVITTQPENATKAKGETVEFTVAATGAESYRWQYKKPDVLAWKDLATGGVWAGVDTDKLSFEATAGRAAYEYRCVVSNGTGAVESSVVTLTIAAPEPVALPSVTSQPVSVTAEKGEEVSFTAIFSGATSLQWKYSNDGGESWKNLANGTAWNGVDTQTLSFTATATRAGYQYRCVGTNDGGSTESNVVTLTIAESEPEPEPVPLPSVTSQPENVTAEKGEEVSFTAIFNGATSLRWQYSSNGGANWKNLTSGAAWNGADTQTLSFIATATRAGYQYRCAATNSAGTVESNVVTLTIAESEPEPEPVPLPSVTSQPENVTAEKGEEVSFTAIFNGATSLRWQYSSNGGANWKNLTSGAAWNGVDTQTLSFIATATRAGYQYRCAATNSAGTVESNVVTLTIAEPEPLPVEKPVFTTQPESVTAEKGEEVSFTVAVTGATSLQWQYSSNGGANWKNLTSGSAWGEVNTETLSFNATATRAKYLYRCLAENGAGAVESDVVTLTVNESVFVINSVTYEKLTDTTCKVVSYSGSDASVRVEAVVNGMTVTEIGQEAFMSKESLVSVELPNSITVIGARAFKDCTNLKSMNCY